MTQVLDRPRASVMGSLADRYQMEPLRLLETLKATCIKGNATNEQVQAFCIVANRYGLDPFLKEIHAFASQGGGIVPIVGIDGWAKIANSTGKLDGCDFTFEGTGDDMACTCTIHVKDRTHPVKVTEYLRECKRNTAPWNQYTRRMLRHKAFMQCVRVAFGLGGGIFDEDEARDILNNHAPTAPAPDGARTKALLAKVTNRDVDTGQVFEPTPEALADAEQQTAAEPDTAGAEAEAPAEWNATWEATRNALVDAAIAAGLSESDLWKRVDLWLVAHGAKGKEEAKTKPAQRHELVEAVMEGRLGADGKIAAAK